MHRISPGLPVLVVCNWQDRLVKNILLPFQMHIVDIGLEPGAARERLERREMDFEGVVDEGLGDKHAQEAEGLARHKRDA